MSSQIQVNTKEKKTGPLKGGANTINEKVKRELNEIINYMYTYTKLNEGKVEEEDTEIKKLLEKKFSDLNTEERKKLLDIESKANVDKEMKEKITTEIQNILIEDLGNEENIKKFVKLYKKFMNRGKNDSTSIMNTLDKEPWYKIIKELSNKDLSPPIKKIYSLILERES